MVSEIDFEPCKIASAHAPEEGRIARLNGVLVALLVSLREGDQAPGWYLLHGYGPCEQEGLIFPSLPEASKWIKQKASTGSRCERDHGQGARSDDSANPTRHHRQ
jgi:hypothetical protein